MRSLKKKILIGIVSFLVIIGGVGLIWGEEIVNKLMFAMPADTQFHSAYYNFAKKLGIDQVATHMGFIPENPSDPDFNGTVAALKHLCRYMKAKGQYFLFETGQETPTTLLRTIQAIGTDNVGINLDTANVILYGRGNPVDALDVFGKYVMDTHIKDGFYPTNGMYLGHEARAGDGKANIPEVVRKLIVEYGYEGPFTIEREISGEQQTIDIIDTKKYLEAMI